jgi:hypothetical protein
MFYKPNLLKILSVIVLLAMIFSNIQTPVAQAHSADRLQREETLDVNGTQTPSKNGNGHNLQTTTSKTHTPVVHPMPDKKKWDQVSIPGQDAIEPLEGLLDSKPSLQNSLNTSAKRFAESKFGPPTDALSTTGPVPPVGALSAESIQYVPGVNASVISGVPSYIWRHGCGPTAAGMLIGYWDSHGYDWLLSGNASTQTSAVDEAIASSIGSQNHYTDYVLPMDDSTPTILPDKSELPLGDEHPSNSLADFMHTSQSIYNLRYGWSYFSDFGPSLVDYVQLTNPGGFAANSTNLYYNSGLTWDVFKAEIDAGRPVGLLVDSDSNGSTDHFVPAFGYDDSSATKMYAAYNTWDYSLHWYEFGPMVAGKPFGIYGAVTLQLGSSSVLPPQTPRNFRQSDATQNSITLAWDDVENETGYNIYQWDWHGEFVYLDSVGADVTSYTVNGLSCDEQNFYEVSAYNANGESGHAPWIEARTDDCRTLISRLTLNRVEVYEFPNGTSLVLTIDDPNTPTSPDYFDDSQTAQLNDPGDPWSGTYANFELGDNYTLKPGDEVTVEGGGFTESMTVADIHVTDVDVDTDTVSGTAGDGIDEISVRVWTSPEFTAVSAQVINNTWTADFSGIYDIHPGDNGVARWWDANENMTSDYWSLPNPNFAVRANSDTLEGWEWPDGSMVTIEIDHDGDGQPEASGTAPVGPAPWNPYEIRFDYNFSGEYDIQPGDVVTVTDGVSTKSTTVTSLAFTDIDLDTDVVTGIASPGAYVNIWICDETGCDYNRQVTANGTTGIWQADFGHVGTEWDEQTIADLVPGTWIDSIEYDGNGNGTMYGINVPNPHIEANILSNWVQAREWPKYTVMTLEIDDLSNGLGGVDYIKAVVMDQAPWNPGDPNDIVADFDLSGFTLEAGDVITVSGEIDGVTKTKVLTASDLQITTFDVDADTVSGMATAGQDVEVCVNIPNNCISHWVTTDGGDGTWTVDYSAEHDLLPGDNGWAADYDNDSDRTFTDWRIPNPRFDAWFRGGWISAYDWPLSTQLTLDIEDPNTNLSPDYSTTTDVIVAPWDSTTTLGEFDVNGVFVIEPGMTIAISGASITKDLIVSSLSIILVDPIHDVIKGGTQPNQNMWMWFSDSCCRGFQADSKGAWMADYSVPGDGGEPIADIGPDSSGTINAVDNDGDNTSLSWYVPEQGYINVTIGGHSKGDYTLDHSDSEREFYAANSGPIKVANWNYLPTLASQRVIFGGKSYSEMMGLPAEQLSKEYWFPYYNNVAMDSQLRVSNLSNAPTNINVYLGIQKIDSFTLGGNGAIRKNYSGKNGGPLRVTSSATNVLSTIRVLYGGNSYSELMGLPAEQLSKEYLFPYYNNVAMDSQLRVSNLGNVPTTITVFLGTQPIDSYSLGAGGAVRKNYTGRNGGPLKVTSSDTNILSTIRVLFNGNSYSELMGYPANQVAKEYWYPVYDNSILDSQLRVSNVGDGPTTVKVYAGGLQIDSYSLGAGAASRKNYAKNTGPLQVVSSSEPILSTIRMMYTTPGYSSYYEMTGLPDTQLSTQYFFPWYNNLAMNSELRFAVP